MHRCIWRLAVVAVSFTGCTPNGEEAVPDTCTPAGGLCVRTDATLGASLPPQAVCVDDGTWNGEAALESMNGFTCPPHVDCGVTAQYSPPTTTSPSRCHTAPQVCCFVVDAGP